MNPHLQKVDKFYSAIREDGRISPVHISLYMGLFYCWMKNDFDNPVSFTSAQMMRISKISGRPLISNASESCMNSDISVMCHHIILFGGALHIYEAGWGNGI